MSKDTLTIAVIGSGAAGLSAAYLLQRKHKVTLIEKNDYIGGHTHTLEIEEGPDRGTPVDTGFIVMNHRNYPLLTQFFKHLGVELQDSDMSFSYHDTVNGLQYSGCGLNGLFAQRRNLFKPRFHKMIQDLFRFYDAAPKDLASGALKQLSLGAYLAAGNYGDMFIYHHIIPMGSAIWSTPCSKMMDFPAASFVQFFVNHGLLSLRDRPQWKTVTGGSRTYVKRIMETFNGEVRTESPVVAVRRFRNQTYLTIDGQEEEVFDAVVIAAHADQALAMLSDATDHEKRLLGAWVYEPNDTVLHTDVNAMPPLKRAWASWNYTRETEQENNSPAALTYHMNRLQRLQTEKQYFVTLNRRHQYPEDTIHASMEYEHPVYSSLAVDTQRELPLLNGVDNTYFCGSYFGYGFHEDAVRSGFDVARQFGIEL
jgi:predicted NAD/FAD-binding protein